MIQSAAVTKTGSYRIEAAPKTVINLGVNRNGCTPINAVTAQTVCDIDVALTDAAL